MAVAIEGELAFSASGSDAAPWQRRRFALKDGRLQVDDDVRPADSMQSAQGAIPQRDLALSLGPLSRGIPFSSDDAPSTAKHLAKSHPFGFVLDADDGLWEPVLENGEETTPTRFQRRLYYFDAFSSSSLCGWLAAIASAAQQCLGRQLGLDIANRVLQIQVEKVRSERKLLDDDLRLVQSKPPVFSPREVTALRGDVKQLRAENEALRHELDVLRGGKRKTSDKSEQMQPSQSNAAEGAASTKPKHDDGDSSGEETQSFSVYAGRLMVVSKKSTNKTGTGSMDITGARAAGRSSSNQSLSEPHPAVELLCIDEKLEALNSEKAGDAEPIVLPTIVLCPPVA